MKRSLVLMSLAFSLLFILAGCATKNARVKLIPPQLEIRQLGGQAMAARHADGGLPVHYVVRVHNPSAETIELERINLSSVGYGAYELDSTSRPFKQSIAPGTTEQVEIWTSAVGSGTVIGVNGPVTLRITAFFDSAVGSFKETYTQQVNTDLAPLPKPQQ